MSIIEEGRRVERFDAVTDDQGEIDHLTRAMFGASVRVERSDGRPPSPRLAQTGVPGFGVQRVTWNVDGRCDVGPLDRFLCIRLRGGAYGLDQGDGQVMYTVGDTFLASPDRRVVAEVVGADLDSITMDRSVLETVAAQIAPWSRGRMDYRRASPVTPRLGAAWSRVLDDVTRILGEDDLAAENSLVRASLTYQLAATACAAFELVPEGSERPVSERSVRRAVTFIDEHVADAITAGDIADAAGVSVRALQSAFQRVLSTTPLAHLRQVRLHAVRRDLLDAAPDTSVSHVARRWGFAHLGRFAHAYRAEFGELPSTTLNS